MKNTFFSLPLDKIGVKTSLYLHWIVVVFYSTRVWVCSRWVLPQNRKLLDLSFLCTIYKQLTRFENLSWSCFTQNGEMQMKTFFPSSLQKNFCVQIHTFDYRHLQIRKMVKMCASTAYHEVSVTRWRNKKQPNFCQKLPHKQTHQLCLNSNILKYFKMVGSGCGAVGRAVAYDIRGPRFESSHRQLLFEHLFTVNCL